LKLSQNEDYFEEEKEFISNFMVEKLELDEKSV